MRRLFTASLLFAFVFALTACGQSEKEIPRNELRALTQNPGADAYEVEGEPFSGILYSTYDNSQRAVQFEMENGELTGSMRGWAENGQQTVAVETQKNSGGKRIPVSRRSWSKKGTPLTLENFNDKGEGILVKEWQPDGTLTSQAEYNDAGKPTLKKQWRKDGTLVWHDQYTDTGKPVFKKRWRGDGEIARVSEYDDQGHIKLKQFWCNKDHRMEQREYVNKIPVHVTHWHCQTHNKISEKHYLPKDKYGIYSDKVLHSDPYSFQSTLTPDGLQQTWWPDGQKKLVSHWKNGKHVDAYRQWYNDGSPKAVGRYNDQGEKNGLWKTWTKDGEQTVADYERDRYVPKKYLRAFAGALNGRSRNFSPDKAMYYIENDLVDVNAKLPAGSRVQRVDFYGADRWPKRNWTYPILVANPKLIKPLLAAGANINAKDSLGRTRLLLCAAAIAGEDCDVEQIRMLLANGADAEIIDASGQSVLHYLVSRPVRYQDRQAVQISALQALLAAGAPVNAQDRGDGDTALIYALAQRRPKLVATLLDAGADVGIENKHGQKAIHYVFLTSANGYTIRNDDATRALLKRMVAAGAYLNAKMPLGSEKVTLHDLAVQQGQIELAKYMERLAAGNDNESEASEIAQQS